MTHDQSILSPAEIIQKIYVHYEHDGTLKGLEWAMSKKLELQVTSQHNQFSKAHPNDRLAQMFNGKESNVDFRVFFLAFPIIGAHFLQVVEACCDIDTAFYKSSEVVLENIKKQRDMDQFSYLKWGDVIHWWGTEFAQLQQDINSERPNRLLNSLKVKKIKAAMSALVGVLAGVSQQRR